MPVYWLEVAQWVSGLMCACRKQSGSVKHYPIHKGLHSWNLGIENWRLGEFLPAVGHSDNLCFDCKCVIWCQTQLYELDIWVLTVNVWYAARHSFMNWISEFKSCLSYWNTHPTCWTLGRSQEAAGLCFTQTWIFANSPLIASLHWVPHNSLSTPLKVYVAKNRYTKRSSSHWLQWSHEIGTI